MKKFIWLLSIISMFGLASCGENEEAKELLARLLRLIGIPQSIVVNICQDDNNNGFCESIELQAKITINKDDSIDDIWQKVSFDENASYLLEHHDPTKKILMELQDSQNVYYDDGKFVFTYNPMSTELSILQMMIDAGHLKESQVIAIKHLEQQEYQDKFYAILLKDLETNLNTLRAEGLTAVQAMSANIKEMADELIINGIADILPQNINNCNGDAICVDKELGVLSDELLIDENESKSIKEAVTKTLKTLLAGKTLYSTIYNKMGTLESVTFNDDLTSATWEELVGGSDIDTSSISMNEMTLTSTDSDGSITTIVVTEIKEDYMFISVGGKEAQRLYFDESKAREYFLSDSNSFTKEMLQDKVVYYHAYTEIDDDQTKSEGYRKMSFSGTSVLMRDIMIFADGSEEDWDEGVTLAFTLINGKIKIDLPSSTDDEGEEDGNIFIYWTLNSHDNTTWSIREEFDVGQDGTIDDSENRTLYFSKPANYPTEL